MKLFGLSISSGTGIALGVGAVLLAPVVVPVIASVVKPVLKAVIKGGLVAYQGAKVTLAETREALEDLAAEAKAEIAEKKVEA
jgi:hypothetical protein